MNKSLIFVEKETCKIDELFSKMDLGSTFGKLIIVQNDYFGSKGIDFLTKWENFNLCIKFESNSESFGESNTFGLFVTLKQTPEKGTWL